MARKVGSWRSFLSRLSLFFRTKDDSIDPVVIEEQKYTLGEATPTRSSGSRDPKSSIIKKLGLAVGESSDDFIEPEWNFEEITNAYNTEGYIRQAVDKYIDMMFKADWKWVGKNPAAVEYVTMRFKLMAEATEIPTDQLFIEIAEDLVKYNNVVIAKARAKDTSMFQGLNVTGISGLQPVAGYFPLNLSTLRVKRDQYGVIKGWQQETDASDKTVKYKPDDIVHIYYKREKGRVFGTPWLLPALDDIRALRQIEENVLRLVYRNLHPLWHVQVGSEQEGMQGEDEEVELVQQEIENMDVEGGLVTTERVKITPIASNQIIDAYNYLKHFEQRAFTVMGVSELLMGRGNTANRSTGDNLSGEFKDRIKALQKVMSTFINEKMVKEILMEGGFDPVLNPDDAVYFTFNEIDMDSQIKAENQAVFLYEHNAITESEMRELIGRDPIEDGEMRAGMHFNIITMAQLKAKGLITSDETASKEETDNRTKPTNQHGTKPSPKKATNTSYWKSALIEYKKANDAIHTLIEQYHRTHSTESLAKIQGVLNYTKDRLMAMTNKYYDVHTTEAVKIPIERMIESLSKRIIDTATSIETISEALDVSQATFDVFIDSLYAIALRADEVYNKNEEV